MALQVQRRSNSDLVFKTQLGEHEPNLADMDVLDLENQKVGRVVSRFGQGKWKAVVPPEVSGDMHISLQRLNPFRF